MNPNSARPARRHSRRPHPLLDALEIRRLLSTRYIVPLGVPIDNATTFGTLEAALEYATPAAGDVLQIEPNSIPGNVTATDVPAANFTIQGDPAAPLASIPMFTLTSMLTVDAAESGFVLKNINMGLVGIGTAGGSLVGTGNITITGSNIVDISSGAVDAITLGGTANVVTNSSLTTEVLEGDLINVATPGGASTSNVFAGNTFLNAFHTSILVLLEYAPTFIDFSGASAKTVTDTVQSNTFVVNAGTLESYFILVASNIDGLSIRNNSFSSAGGNYGVRVTGSAKNLVIANNTINLGKNSIGVSFVGGGASTLLSASLVNNRISIAGGGTAIAVLLGPSTTSVINLKAAGNDFHNDVTAVHITGGGAAASLGGLDFGGGSQSSLGGNDFRGYTTISSTTTGAFVLTSVAGGAGTISIQKDIFDSGFNATAQTTPLLNFANPLSANASFVQTLYEGFLKRTGDTANGSDAGYWVNALNASAMTTAQVSTSIAHSAEALSGLVDALYSRYLGRLPDAGGRAYFLGVLQTPGQGVESMVAQLVTSPEYANQFAADGVFVQSLYTRLLGRLGTTADVTIWVNSIASSSRAAVVTSFLQTGEFRSDVAQQLYGFNHAPLVATASILLPLLHRTIAPSAGELNYWINSGQGMLTMDLAFAQTGEYFNNG